MRRIHLIALVFLVIGVTVGVLVYMYFVDTREVKISVDGAEQISLHEKQGDDFKEVRNNISQGETIRVRPGSTYRVHYTGASGFAGDIVSLNPLEETFTASADYTDAKLIELYSKQKTEIEKVLLQRYPEITSLYTITKGALYERGEWYGALLEYKGAAFFNRDNLRVIMQKEGNAWKVPWLPSPSANIYNQVGAPEEVLIKVNSL